jgi:hypothetical protein
VMQARIGFTTQVTPMRAYTREKAPV